MSEPAPGISCDRLLLESRGRTGLRDFGDPWPLSNCREFLRLLESDARFTASGKAGAYGMIARAFDNRLRHVEQLKRHPDILNEPVAVAAIIASLPRTGSTLLHRMLAQVPGFVAPKWYETQNYAPFPGEERGDTSVRRKWGASYLEQMLTAMPELMSIHPMELDEADEEIMSMGLLFSSTMIEGTYFLPDFAKWLSRNSRTQVYADLRRIIQAWQWHNPAYARRRWLLKTPGHLLALDAAAQTFPEALIVMTHRDPVEILPSFANLTFQFYNLAGNFDREQVGAFWLQRLGKMLDTYLDTRDQLGDARFIDVHYNDLVADPIMQGERVLDRLGFAADADTRAMMQAWLDRNAREKRPPHVYETSDFGFDADMIKARFSRYRERFIRTI